MTLSCVAYSSPNVQEVKSVSDDVLINSVVSVCSATVELFG